MNSNQHEEARNNSQEPSSSLIEESAELQNIIITVLNEIPVDDSSPGQDEDELQDSEQSEEPEDSNLQLLKKQGVQLSVGQVYSSEVDQIFGVQDPASKQAAEVEIGPSGEPQPKATHASELTGHAGDSNEGVPTEQKPQKGPPTTLGAKKRQKLKPKSKSGNISELPAKEPPKAEVGGVLGKRRPGSLPSCGFCKIKHLQAVSGGGTQALCTRHARVDCHSPQAWGSGGRIQSCRPTGRATKKRRRIQPSLAGRSRSGSHYSSESDFDQWRNWILHPEGSTQRQNQLLHQEAYPLLFSQNTTQFVEIRDHDIQLVNEGISNRGADAVEILYQESPEGSEIPIRVDEAEGQIPPQANMVDELFFHGPHIELGLIQHESMQESTSNVYSS